jgi:hypothetical protein
MNFKLSDNFINVIIIIVLIIILLNSPCISGKENFEGIFGEEDLKEENEEVLGEEDFYEEEDY